MKNEQIKTVNDELTELLTILQGMKIDLNSSFPALSERRRQAIDKVCHIKKLIRQELKAISTDNLMGV